jgi:8-oxo-dGTP diphosphatase
MDESPFSMTAKVVGNGGNRKPRFSIDVAEKSRDGLFRHSKSTKLLRVWRFLARWPAVQRLILSLFNPRFLIGVVAVIRDDRGRVLLFHHTYRRRFHWSLPGGWLKRGEEPAACVVREIKEETDLDIEVVRPLRALAGPVAPNFEVVYLARLLGGAFRPSAEVDKIAWFTADDLPDLKPYQRELILAELSAAD